MNAVRTRDVARWLCATLALCSGMAAFGQEMIGPSSTTPGIPTNPVTEAPETLSEDTSDAGEPRATVGSDDVVPAQVMPEIADQSFQYALNWRELIDAGEIDEAVSLAKTWVTDATVQHGQRTVETFIPLVRLAESYALSEQTALAGKTYADAVIVAERRLGPFSPSLVEPLVGIGTALAMDGEHEGAVSALMRAKDITHRNQGIYNPEQAPIVDKLTSSYVHLGEVRQATREQRLLFGSQEKLVGSDSVEFVPALQKWGRWNAQIQRFTEARRYFHQAINLLEQRYGPNDLRLVETLNMIADSFYINQETNFPREGARALSRAVEIYESQDSVDQMDLLRSRTKLADWYLIAGRHTQAVETYTQAIGQAREAGVSDELIDARFGIPRKITKSNLPVGMWPHERVRVEEAHGVIVLEFDVDERGKPRNIRVVKDTVRVVSVLKLVRLRHSKAKFRPRFVNGKSVVTYGSLQEYSF